MSEVRDADEAVQARQEAISQAISESTGIDARQVYRSLFIGMDIRTEDVLDIAEEHAVASATYAIEQRQAGHEIVLNEYVEAAWLDGFSVAAMLFLRRHEHRDDGQATCES